MRDFSDGIELGVNEDEYRATIQEYHGGLVVSLNRSRKGQFTLHNATCSTLTFDLAPNEGPNQTTRRTGKVLFRNHDELDAWLASQPDLGLGDLNRCSRCM
jgi:hypothetical protein